MKRVRLTGVQIRSARVFGKVVLSVLWTELEEGRVRVHEPMPVAFPALRR